MAPLRQGHREPDGRQEQEAGSGHSPTNLGCPSNRRAALGYWSTEEDWAYSESIGVWVGACTRARAHGGGSLQEEKQFSATLPTRCNLSTKVLQHLLLLPGLIRSSE